MEHIDEEWIAKRGSYGPGYTFTPIEKKGKERRLMFTWNDWTSIGYLVTDLEYGNAFCGVVALHWEDGTSTITRRDCKTGKRSTRKVKSPPYVKELKYENF